MAACAVSPLQGATLAARQSRFHGVPAKTFHFKRREPDAMEKSMNENQSPPIPELARQMANAIRMLAVDAVEKAKSGHPGAW